MSVFRLSMAIPHLPVGMALLFLAGVSAVPGADWPQFLGPTRNGAGPEVTLSPWPPDGPVAVWEAPVGEGFSSPVVADGTVHLFHRTDDRELLSAWNLSSGKRVWEAGFPTDYSDDLGSGDGPKSTPAVAGNRLFCLSPAGVLRAVSRKDGRKLWEVDLMKQFDAGRGFFGFATSPLVVSNRVVVQVGGEGAGTVAFDAADGSVAWKAGSDEAGYGSPTVWKRDGRTLVLAFNRAGAVAHAVDDGAERFRFPWRSRMHASVNAATPLVFPDGLFLTASYGTGAAWVRPEGTGAKVLWSGDDILSAHFTTPAEADGFLYGFHGRHESGPSFRCVERASGRVRWNQDGMGSGSVVRIGKQLLVLLETGEMRVLAVDPDKPREIARFQVCGSGARMVPALADGFLVVRDRSRIRVRRLPSEINPPATPGTSTPPSRAAGSGR